MTKHTITLEGPFVVSKGPKGGAWKANATIDLGAIPASIVLDLALHGLKQKVADAASGATNVDEALGAMNKAIDAVLAGEWSSRGTGEGVSEQTRVERQIVREVYKAKVGGKSAEWKAFDGLDIKDQAAKLDAMFAKNEAALRPAVDAKLEELRRAREAKAKLTSDFQL